MFKNKFNLRNMVVIAVSLAGFTVFSGCNKDDSNDDSNDNSGETSSRIAGKFTNPTGSGDVVFYADYSTTETKAAKAGSEKELVGKIEDGDIVFNLEGVYDVENGKFFLSAGSSILIFQIVGTLADEVMSNTEATVKIKSSDDWTEHTVAVTPMDSDNVSIDGTVSDSQENGVPTAWFGNWMALDEDGESMNVTMTAWQFINREVPDEPAGFLDIVSLTGGKLEMIWEMYVHYANENSDGSRNEWTEKEFCKIWMELSGQNLLITVFEDSLNESYAAAKAYNTATADDDSKGVITFTRP